MNAEKRLKQQRDRQSVKILTQGLKNRSSTDSNRLGSEAIKLQVLFYFFVLDESDENLFGFFH